MNFSWLRFVNWWALPILAGLVLPLAFSPFELSLVAPLALAVLFISWRSSTPKRALLQGYFFGVGCFSSGTSWVYISMHEYGGATALAAFILTLLFVLILAAFPALSAWLATRVTSKRGWLWLFLVCPSAWVVGEWCRSWFMTGFPWLQLGYSLMDTPLSSFAPLLGIYGLSAITALFAASLAYLFISPCCHWKFSAVVIVSLLAVGEVMSGINWSHPAGEPFRATLIQGNIDQNLKWRPEVRQQTLRMYMQKTRENQDSDVVVWPETAVPAYYHQLREQVLLPFAESLRPSHTDLLFGVPVMNQETNQYFNSLVSLSIDNETIYHKRHLVPFGEYLPLQPLSRIILDYLKIPMSDFTHGDRQQALLTAAGYPLVASICYEDVYGGESLTGIQDSRYLVNVTNDAWFSGSIASSQHLQMARMRALETARYMLRASNNGRTAIINQYGEVTEKVPPYQFAVLSGDVVPLEGMTFYARTGDWPVLISAWLVLLSVCWGSMRAAQKQS